METMTEEQQRAISGEVRVTVFAYSDWGIELLNFEGYVDDLSNDENYEALRHRAFLEAESHEMLYHGIIWIENIRRSRFSRMMDKLFRRRLECLTQKNCCCAAS